MELNIVILAAGQGKRMKSDLPKVLHPLGGRPMLSHVLSTARSLQPERLVVVHGHGGQKVIQAIADNDINWVEQTEQLGTGHAVEQAIPQLSDNAVVLILYGDIPLITNETLSGLVSLVTEDSFALLTVHVDEPAGYGRIVRDAKQQVQYIKEEKDASDKERQSNEVNTGIMALSVARLNVWLKKLENNNAQGEFYLTDIIGMAVDEGLEIKTMQPQCVDEVLGINSKSQLAYLERSFQRRQAEGLMRQGVTLLDPARIDIRGEVRVGQDVTLDVGVVLEGEVELGDNVYIGPNCVIRNTKIDNGVQVFAMCIIEEAKLGRDSRVGPFSRIRPGTQLAENTHIGNFVEIKNSDIGDESKVNHLSYVGDSTVGKRVNIGAGTITCNYDGANKHRTIIGDDAFIGSDTQLVAPVEVREGSTIGAGSTITQDTPADQLSLSRSPQKTIEGWKRPVKKKI